MRHKKGFKACRALKPHSRQNNMRLLRYAYIYLIQYPLIDCLKEARLGRSKEAAVMFHRRKDSTGQAKKFLNQVETPERQ